MKSESHAGCLLNGLADELAERGVTSENEQICPGPSKVGTIWLRIRESWWTRVRTEQLHHIIHGDTASNKSILKQVTAVNLLLSIKNEIRNLCGIFSTGRKVQSSLE